MSAINLYHGDSLAAMLEMEDKAYDLAIVDPEYRDINQPTQQMRAKGSMKNWKGRTSRQYFDEVRRVSANQIIWGGNYYANSLPENNNWIVWYKNNDGTGFSMAEMAWCSIVQNTKVFELRSAQTLQYEGERIHPTQKPVKLYKWLLSKYAKSGDRILDTHGGSMSIAIACHDMGFDLDLWEIDKDYYDAGVKRFEAHKAQTTMFTPQEMYNQ